MKTRKDLATTEVIYIYIEGTDLTGIAAVPGYHRIADRWPRPTSSPNSRSPGTSQT